jgi:hypothetical protein
MYEVLTKEDINKIEDYINRDANPVVYLSIDPGTKNGVCGYDKKAYLVFMFTVHADDMTSFLEKFHKVKKCIIEDFVLYPNKTQDQVYSDMLTSRVIGRVETWAERKDIELIKQGARIKPTGYKWIGQKPLPKSNPKNHSLDAHVHFMYWAIRNNVISASEILRDHKVQVNKNDLQK